MTDKTQILSSLNGPRDLRGMSLEQLQTLAAELRDVIRRTVERTGGHLASNMGVVELTLALHCVYDFAVDRLVWDVGHQCYPHKLLTDRARLFHTLRQSGGISGFPNPNESPYDLFVSGHAGTSISEALGLILADRLQGQNNKKTVAVIGDGSLTSGMALEALNHAGDSGANLLVILNDNRMSISQSVGGLSNYLNRIRSAPMYNEARRELRGLLEGLPIVGQPIEHALERVREAMVHWKYGTIFEDLGFRYFGPLDGHNIRILLPMLRQIHDQHFNQPVLLHVFTEKGHGDEAAAGDPTKFHSFSPKSGSAACARIEAEAKEKPRAFTKVFSQALIEAAETSERVCAITAAMPGGTGLDRFACRFPTRTFDVGICEQHAVGLAEGLSRAGLRPVVAIYSTFMQRAYDQVFHDACLQGLPVVFAMDRAGLVGADGPTHHGVFDIAMLRHLPGIVCAAPADAAELAAMLKLSLAHDGPFAIRYPKAEAVEALPGNDVGDLAIGRSRTLREGPDGCIVACGPIVQTALDAADRLAESHGTNVAVVNARFAKPLDDDRLTELMRTQPWMITIEEHARAGGFGSAVLELAARTDGARCPIRTLGVPDRFIPHGDRPELLARCGLDAATLVETARTLAGTATLLDSCPSSDNAN
jgi:1-deoxy-D-xylulose-5-phosphate synthase